jgi:hypothetical protein
MTEKGNQRMDQPANTSRPTWSDHLHHEVDELLGQLEGLDLRDNQNRVIAHAAIFTMLEAATKQSWKNGIDAGRRKASGQGSRGPQRPSALEAGKLKRV